MKRIATFLAALAVSVTAPGSAQVVDLDVANVRKIMAGTVTTASVKQAYLSGARDNTTAFQGALAAYRALPKPTVRCVDGTMVPAPGACPVIVTPPPPPPVQCPDGTTVPAGQTCPTLPPPSPVIAKPGDIVVALQPCVGSFIPDAVVVGKRYRVISANLGVRPAPGVDPKVSTHYTLNPELDDGLHRGDGYFALAVPYSCAVKV